jgi:hypothetical protein
MILKNVKNKKPIFRLLFIFRGMRVHKKASFRQNLLSMGDF